MARLSREDVEHVAHLGRLRLSAEEVELLTSQLNDIVNYFQQLQELDTEDILPTSHSVTVENVMRDDEPRPSFSRDDMLTNAPESGEGCYVVPRIVGDEPSH